MKYVDRKRVAEEIRVHKQSIARAVTDEFLDRHPEWVEWYGSVARLRGEEDAAFHVEFLAGAVMAEDAGAFEDYARWTAGVLESRGIKPDSLVENLEQVRDAAATLFDEAGRTAVREIANAGIQALRHSSKAEDEARSPHSPFDTEISLYLQAVLAGQRRAALNIALETLSAGATVLDIYQEVLQPVQYRIGQLWERNEITVATEHMATAITQYVVGQLYSHLEIPATSRGNAVLTGVKGELHQLGANMVADVLEADGWNVRFLGTQLPHLGVIEAIDEHEPLLLGISATVLFNLQAVADLIDETRKRYGDEVAILVGGAAFRSKPEIWRDMGADGFGQDLKGAVAVAAEIAPKEA